MKLKKKTLLESTGALAKLFSQEMPVELAYKISKNISIVEGEMKDFFKIQSEISNKFVDKETKKIPDDKLKEIEKLLGEELEKEIELKLITIKLKDLKEIKDLALSPINIKKLEYIVVE